MTTFILLLNYVAPALLTEDLKPVTFMFPFYKKFWEINANIVDSKLSGNISIS